MLFIDDDEGTDDALLTHQTLIDTQERLGSLLDLMPTGLIIHQMQGILYANQQAIHLFNQSKDALIGQHLLDFIDEDVRADCADLFMRSFVQDTPVQLPQIKLTTDPDNTRYVKVTAGRLPWEGTTVIQILLEDITELKLKADELENLTFNDALTGTYNRRYFIEHAEKMVAKAILENKSFSLMIFDVDWFKKVNDTFGHLAGDEALKSIATVWDQNTRRRDEKERSSDGKLARIGGEEFAILLPDIDLMTAQMVAERIRTSIENHDVTYEDQTFNITASFGLTDLRPNDIKLDDLIRRADIALYRAKEKGRNRVECE
ncbi:sensor domain-containing diguanylate cyclase [Terasakiella sp. A23]|uniref:sensor domain-containing diguanylate cyclase n=1 Tax=Terasakiella sp. FCG-A23 TaxID=3080561 RepID=UPI002953BDA4|nr:sensor domain-containing diguanylate cyclase [Terasakiella sp. A23]MDV7339129.1 sensor domain-containing diguanylate cyclase [Terasakiella sp. A23]